MKLPTGVLSGYLRPGSEFTRADVADAALKLRAERSQLEMDLEVVDD